MKRNKLEDQGRGELLLSSGNMMEILYLIAFKACVVNLIINFYY